MTESILTTCNDDRHAAFVGITHALPVDRFSTTAQIDKMLEDLAAAESWESMALRSISRSTAHRSESRPVPVTGGRRAA
ncbi:MAG TPA: hypothetical protein VH395_16180 [Jatrophihabitantaceae bacterium]|jgi:hypothetical protein